MLLTSSTQPVSQDAPLNPLRKIRLGAGQPETLKVSRCSCPPRRHSRPLNGTRKLASSETAHPVLGSDSSFLPRRHRSTYPLQQTGKTSAQPDRRDWPQLRLVEWVYLAK